MIRFKELHLQNFRAWKELHLVDLNKRGLCSIEGENGSGKSAIRQAIEYLLTDDTSDAIDVDELPFNKDKDCIITGILDKDGHEVNITKYRNHYRELNKIIVSIDDDKSLSCPVRKDTQRNIEGLLGITSDYIYLSTIFSQNSTSFPSSKDSERKQFLYSCLDLSKYDGYQSSALSKVSLIEKEIESLNNDFLFSNRVIKDLQKSIGKLKIDEENFETNLSKEIDVLKEQRDALLFTVSIDIEDAEPLEEEYNSLLEREKELLEQKTSLTKDLISIKNKIKNIGTGTCSILDIFCEKLSVKVESITSVLKQDLDEVKIKLEGVTVDLSKVKDSAIKLKSFIDVNNKHKIEQARENSELEQLEQRIDKLSKNRDNPYTQVLKDQIQRVDEEIKKKADIEQKLAKLKIDILYPKFWIVGFGKSGIPNLKIEGILDDLESLTNKYLSYMTKSMLVKIDAQKELKSTKDIREEISYKIISNRPITNYKSYSGGEKQRIRIADILAFNELLGKFDIMILDEVLELSLDDKGKSSVLDILREKANTLGSIFVISHSGIIKDKIDTTIKVKNVNGIAKLIEEN